MGQGLIGLAVTAAFFMWQGWPAAGAAGYGALLALANAALLGLHIGRASQAALGHPAQGQARLYFGAAQRFILLGVCFALGMGLLGLPPFPMILAFALAQLALFLHIRPLEV